MVNAPFLGFAEEELHKLEGVGYSLPVRVPSTEHLLVDVLWHCSSALVQLFHLLFYLLVVRLNIVDNGIKNVDLLLQALHWCQDHRLLVTIFVFLLLDGIYVYLVVQSLISCIYTLPLAFNELFAEDVSEEFTLVMPGPPFLWS